MISKRLREHLEQGGGNAAGDTQWKLLGGGQEVSKFNPQRLTRVWNIMGPFAVHGLRHYAHMREIFLEGFSFICQRLLLKKKTVISENDEQFHARRKMIPRRRYLNLGKILKTLMHVHAVQVMQDGIFNIDPHPGNVLVMEDGRLGLLDYGMVGRLSESDRTKVAQVIVAHAQNKPEIVAQVYLDSEYHVELNGKLVTDPNILFRLSSGHLNKFDLSPVVVSQNSDESNGKQPKTMKAMDLYEALDVIHVPDWILQVRRVGRLMMGVSAQAARPVSLAKEWEPVAKRTLRDAETTT